MRIKENYHVYAITTILFWSLAYVLTRVALQYFSPEALGFLRYIAAGAAMAAVAALARLKPPAVQDWPVFFATGLFGFCLYMILFNKGCVTVSAATSSVIIATVPVITAVMARAVYKEKLSALQWAATAVEFAGVSVMMLADGGLSINVGILWLLAAAASLSVYNLLQRRLTKTYTAIQTTAYSIFAGTAALSVYAPGSFAQAAAAPRFVLVYVIILGVFSSALAFATWSVALSKADKASSVSNYMFVTPFLTSMLGFIMIGERPGASVVIGGGIIMAGLALFNMGRRGHHRSIATKKTAR